MLTLLSGGSTVSIGARVHSVVLVAFGMVGLLDAIGSFTLAVHFRHAIRHEAISVRLERIALTVVASGMAVVGGGTITVSVLRLVNHNATRSVLVGTIVAAISALGLTLLAARKRRISLAIPSRALLADSWVSALGAILALFALVGTGLNQLLGWWWLDPASAVGVAVGALLVGITMVFKEAVAVPSEAT